MTAPGLSGLAKLLFDHAWDGYAGGEVMCECKWSSADGDPSVQKYDAYARHLEDAAREAGWLGPDQHLAEVERWMARADEAGAGFGQVCRDYADLAARNTELARALADAREKAEFAAEVASRHKAAVGRVRALVGDKQTLHASGHWVVRVGDVRDALEYPEEKL